MIIRTNRKEIINKDLVSDTQYFGNSVCDSKLPLSIKNDFKKYQGCTCIASEGIEGIVIGFEDSESLNDFYWILYGSDGKLHYELYNSVEFYKGIQQ